MGNTKMTLKNIDDLNHFKKSSANNDALNMILLNKEQMNLSIKYLFER